MVRLNWTDEAKYHLKNIFDFIAIENPKAAKNVINKIREKAQILKSYPEIGGIYQNLNRKDVRLFTILITELPTLLLTPRELIFSVYSTAQWN